MNLLATPKKSSPRTLPVFDSVESLAPIKSPPFLSKLSSILSLKTIEHIVSWLPEGKIWRIHKFESFVSDILPLFDEMPDWETFLVALHLHGFEEVSRGFNSLAFYNENFLLFTSLRLADQQARGYDYTSPSQTSPALLAGRDALYLRAGILHGESLNAGAIQSLFLQQKQELPSLLASKVLQPAHTQTGKATTDLASLLHLNALSKGVFHTEPDQQDGRKRKSPVDCKSSSAPSTGKKKPRKKWLPPLGPPEAESVAILGKRAAAGAWGHASAEAFSTLSSLRH